MWHAINVLQNGGVNATLNVSKYNSNNFECITNVDLNYTSLKSDFKIISHDVKSSYLWLKEYKKKKKLLTIKFVKLILFNLKLKNAQV